MDEVDIKIISKLAQNGRISLTELSSATNLSRVAIANRIEKLMRTDVLRVSALVNLEKLNYQTLIIELQIDKNKIAHFKKLVANEPRVLQCFETTGPYNFLLVCAAKSNNHLRNFLEDTLKKICKDCKVIISSNPVHPEFVPIKDVKSLEM
ncbi:MAG: Lrp/AsnC family transcriptional regulator [Candidatus Nanoarchaeia archaeon]